VSLQRVLALITAPQPNQLPAKPDWSLTSFALAVEPDRVQLDVWLPSPEFKAVVKKNGWW
jgi:hypothetical protein